MAIRKKRRRQDAGESAVEDPAEPNQLTHSRSDHDEDVFDRGTQEIIRDAILRGGMDRETAADIAKKLGASLLASLIYSKTREFFKHLPQRVKNMYQDRQLLQVKLPNEEVAKWLVTHVHEQKLGGEGGGGQLEALVDDSIEFRNSVDDVSKDALRGRNLVRLIPSADADTTQFEYEGHTFEINREYSKKSNGQPQGGGPSAYKGKPQWHIKTWTADKETLKELLREAAVAAYRRSQDKVKIHRMNSFGNWRSEGFSRGMSLDSLVLEQGQKDEVTGRMESFLRDEKFSRKYGTPWRIGFLLEGPHGTGKTSLVRAIALEYEMDLYEVNVCSHEMDDASLKHAMSNIGEGEIALIEDVDAIYDSGDGSTHVSPKGFSTAIDGVAEQPGRVLFMTTNNADALGERVTRPGRVDHVFRLGLATADMARRFFLKFNEGEREKAEAFAEALGDRNYSPAAIQNHFATYRDAGEALEHADEIRKPGEEHAT